MTKKVLVSIIFPLLNAEDDLRQVSQAIASQEKIEQSKLEVIFVDDGSTDKTPKTIKEVRDLFTSFANTQIITHKKRSGLAQTRYDGAKKAHGEFLTFVDKKTRPDKDYLASLLSKKHNIVIGNVYMDKKRSLWDRLLVTFRKKLYFPYFNHPFKDELLDYNAYRRFKNKGGGGAMLVKRDYFLEVAAGTTRGKDSNDDSQLIERLSKIEPILKTSSAKLKYLNRTGFMENVNHMYNRGPKFVDYYIRPGTRFFLPLLMFFAVIPLALITIVYQPQIITYVAGGLVVLLLLIALYLSEEPLDFLTIIILLPVAVISFCSGLIKGILMKFFRKY